MAELRYRWGEGKVQETATPPGASIVALWVGDHEVWTGCVTEELRAWARWCALEVVELWPCPDVVRTYLETGDEALKDTACEAAWNTIFECKLGDDQLTAQLAARAAAWAAAPDTFLAMILSLAGTKPSWADLCMRLLGRLLPQHLHGPVDVLRIRQAARLRALVLHRALPTHLHALADDRHHEPVLCDVLLTAAHPTA